MYFPLTAQVSPAPDGTEERCLAFSAPCFNEYSPEAPHAGKLRNIP
jgi:hypothetical protein